MGISAEAIQAAYLAEGDHDQKVFTAWEVPGTYNALTREWLTDVLCAKVPGASVERFDLDERDDGSSSRRRIFLTYNDAGSAANLPKSVFCKAAETLASRIILGTAATALGEVNFYNKVKPRIDIETPVSYYAGFNPRNFAYFVIMDDIASQVTFVDERDSITRGQAESLVSTMAILHSAFYESPELGTETLPFLTFPQCWADLMTGMPAFASYCGQGFIGARDVMSAKLFERQDEIWPATTRSVEQHLSLPRTLIHGDVHWKNWYTLSDDQVGLFDWQLITIGHWTRDFIYALTTSLTIEQRRAWFDDLLRLYLKEMAERGVLGLTFEDAMLNIRQQIFTALAFWTITLRPADNMPAMQPERTSLEFLRRILAAVDDFGSLDAFAT